MSLEQPKSAASQPKPERPPLDAIITEPDTARLTGYRDQYGVDQGKFIRIGDLVLLAPLIRDTDTFRDHDWSHLDMLWSAFQGSDANLRLKAFAELEGSESLDDKPTLNGEPLLRDDAGLVDAGYYSLGFSAEVALETLSLYGRSHDYGRAEEAGRQKTADLIQEKMGPEIGIQQL